MVAERVIKVINHIMKNVKALDINRNFLPTISRTMAVKMAPKILPTLSKDAIQELSSGVTINSPFMFGFVNEFNVGAIQPQAMPMENSSKATKSDKYLSVFRSREGERCLKEINNHTY